MTIATAVALLTMFVPSVALAGAPEEPEAFILGLGTDTGGEVLVANTAIGIMTTSGDVVVELPGVADVAASDQGWLWAITGGPDSTLWKVQDGVATPFADLGAFEAKFNPHPAAVDSNAFSVADLGRGEAVVVDAAGNTLLRVNKHGKVKLIAVFPDEMVSTANAKAVVEGILSNLASPGVVTCDALPDWTPPDAVDICNLPPMLPAEAVPTSVVVLPNGDFLVGELKGFPAPTGESRVWRVKSNARNAKCGGSSKCSVAFDGFTSITDMTIADRSLYVAEIDENSWFAVELAAELPADLAGGTVNACRRGCTEVATGVELLSALTTDGSDAVWWAGLFGPVQML